jgi:hypothetical protein
MEFAKHSEARNTSKPTLQQELIFKKIWLIFILQQLRNIRKQICFSGFKYYHNPKYSGPYTAGRQGGQILRTAL